MRLATSIANVCIMKFYQFFWNLIKKLISLQKLHILSRKKGYNLEKYLKKEYIFFLFDQDKHLLFQSLVVCNLESWVP